MVFLTLDEREDGKKQALLPRPRERIAIDVRCTDHDEGRTQTDAEPQRSTTSPLAVEFHHRTVGVSGGHDADPGYERVTDVESVARREVDGISGMQHVPASRASQTPLATRNRRGYASRS